MRERTGADFQAEYSDDSAGFVEDHRCAMRFGLSLATGDCSPLLHCDIAGLGSSHPQKELVHMFCKSICIFAALPIVLRLPCLPLHR